VVASLRVTVSAISNSGVGAVRVTKGDLLRIAATGTWCMGGAGATAECGGPGGIRATHIDEPPAVVATAKIGTLLARLGAGPWFVVGTGRTFTAGQTGLLTLMFNDIPGRYGDNSRSISASILVTR
jgi:hypothetical protein